MFCWFTRHICVVRSDWCILCRTEATSCQSNRWVHYCRVVFSQCLKLPWKHCLPLTSKTCNLYWVLFLIQSAKFLVYFSHFILLPTLSNILLSCTIATFIYDICGLLLHSHVWLSMTVCWLQVSPAKQLNWSRCSFDADSWGPENYLLDGGWVHIGATCWIRLIDLCCSCSAAFCSHCCSSLFHGLSATLKPLNMIWLFIWPTMSCFADWSKRCHVMFIIIECWTCRQSTVQYCK